MSALDMPPAPASFEARGGWLISRLMTEFGLTAPQAAGIVGNLGFESRGFTVMQEIGQPPPRGGWGWAQWTGPRRRAFEAWRGAHELAPASDEANYGFLLAELRGDYRHTIAMLKKATTDADAVFSVGQTYERPSGTTPTHLPDFDERLRYARLALKGMAPPPRPPGWDVDIANAVRALQLVLTIAGLYKGEIDADPGPRTLNALTAWRQTQRAKG